MIAPIGAFILGHRILYAKKLLRSNKSLKFGRTSLRVPAFPRLGVSWRCYDPLEPHTVHTGDPTIVPTTPSSLHHTKLHGKEKEPSKEC